MNDKFREFEVQQKEASDGIKSTHDAVLSDLKAKEETLVQNLEARLSSLVDDAGKSLLNDMKDKRSACANILKETRDIQESIEPSLRTSLQASLTAMIEDEKRKLGTYLKKEVHRHMKDRSTSQDMIQVGNKELTGNERPRDSTVTVPVQSTMLLPRNSGGEKVRVGLNLSKVGAKRVSPIQSVQVSSDDSANGETERTVDSVGASPPQENASSSSNHNEKIRSAAAVEIVVEDDKNENFKSVEDANSSLPPTKGALYSKTRATGPNPIRRYNLRSSDATSSRVGTARTSEVAKHISNDRNGTATMKRLTTKKLAKSQPTSQKKISQTSCRRAGTESASATDSQSEKENSTNNATMTPQALHTPTQTPKKVILKKGNRRRRRIGAHKTTAKNSIRSKDNSVPASSNAVGGNLRTSRSLLSRNRVPSNCTAYRSPSYTLPNASRSSNQRVLRDLPSSTSPGGVDSIFGPPPIPTLDGLTRASTNFIAPRPSFMSNFDFDTLSFQ
mmetsp:Transcript_21083/g.31668  ORF Transcript_21083/g.31668 Transcript_21083/m.31668 type:complete len:503 (+) Transcript_21083:1-1509(+)